ncbi:oligopeptide transporter, OPT family [Dethiosulfovibrio sp. F2B]|uniref:OPT family oligopeptide transporter n=1 Tax=Dethiosulfovibrio faecalis TaxID=2720018 RepID=UPI001F32324C|nr:oligopeptide transporter, OPT family [Dethiosulfovibrio faecalis]MCF4152264.1 oligopeptide transporter, OPT family [Dethiosulfovibrio faecalis]
MSTSEETKKEPIRRLPEEAYEVMDGDQYPPYVSSDKKIPELTFRAIFLGFILSIVLGAANAYLGLKVGMTVSASIPAAVISMGIMRGILKKGTILENNIVQTIASSGESLAAGVIFTVPALYILARTNPQLVPPKLITVTLMSALGGLLGLLFMIPLRRFLIVKEHGNIPYPEGAACAEVLVAGEVGGAPAKTLFASLGLAGVYRFAQAGMKIFPEEIEWGIKGFTGAHIGADIFPSLMGVGFIVGRRIATIMLVGGVVAWLGVIPLIEFFGRHSADAIFPAATAVSELGVWGIWNKYIRYVGAGAVAFGGLLSFVEALPTIINSFKAVMKRSKNDDGTPERRTQQDLPGKIVTWGSLLVAVSMLFVLPIDNTVARIVSAIAVVVFGFFFVTVSSRIVGLVGSSNNPVSGMTIATLLLTAILVKLGGISGIEGILASLTAGSVVCIALACAGDMSQDLKTGFLVGSTPKYQQIGEMIGTVAAALVIGLVLIMLDSTYGFGSKELPAPQAGLMAMVVQGIFQGDLPWTLVWIGAALGLCARLVQIPVLPFGIGLYLPIHLSVPIFFGSLIREAVMKKFPKGHEKHKPALETGMLISSGFVAGDALVGLLAAFLAYVGVADKIAVGGPLSASGIGGLVLFMVLALYMYRKCCTAEAD